MRLRRERRRAKPPPQTPPPATPDASVAAPQPQPPQPPQPPQADDPHTCTADADCPRLACGPCKTDDVVTHHDTSINCFRNPCPSAKAHCVAGVCKIAAP